MSLKNKITNINALYDKKSPSLHIVNKNQKYILEDLMKKKIYELIEICKVMGITGYWVNDKNRLIQLILVWMLLLMLKQLQKSIQIQ